MTSYTCSTPTVRTIGPKVLGRLQNAEGIAQCRQRTAALPMLRRAGDHTRTDTDRPRGEFSGIAEVSQPLALRSSRRRSTPPGPRPGPARDTERERETERLSITPLIALRLTDSTEYYRGNVGFLVVNYPNIDRIH
ncbi:unnamed protein product [Heligmosomoides polygyrus]|uniref:NHR domain-containing protein n=1 Tax=Heligmosomoides polygyrus TaxID=6339 RepID=A0A183G832_HELPZ|nr:unnamed protein product [Heligmosomoides polygyrus]